MNELSVIQDNGRKDIVEMLEGLLERAKLGEIHSFAAAGLLTERRFMTSFQTADDGDKAALLGAVLHLQHRIHVALDAGDESG